MTQQNRSATFRVQPATVVAQLVDVGGHRQLLELADARTRYAVTVQIADRDPETVALFDDPQLATEAAEALRQQILCIEGPRLVYSAPEGMQ